MYQHCHSWYYLRMMRADNAFFSVTIMPVIVCLKIFLYSNITILNDFHNFSWLFKPKWHAVSPPKKWVRFMQTPAQFTSDVNATILNHRSELLLMTYRINWSNCVFMFLLACFPDKCDWHAANISFLFTKIDSHILWTLYITVMTNGRMCHSVLVLWK